MLNDALMGIVTMISEGRVRLEHPDVWRHVRDLKTLLVQEMQQAEQQEQFGFTLAELETRYVAAQAHLKASGFNVRSYLEDNDPAHHVARENDE